MENETKFLLQIDSALNFKTHYYKVISKLNTAYFQIRNLKTIIDQKTLIKFYYGQIYRRLAYGIIFWGTFTAMNDVLIAQKKL